MSAGPPPPIRRVVTGHDGNDAVVIWDEPAAIVREAVVPAKSRLSVLWSSDQNPADVSVGTSIRDYGIGVRGTPPPPEGTRFSVLDLPPGCPGGIHRTESLDYAIVLAGEVAMELDRGVRVSLNAGDVVIQRATNHSWINRGTTWARVAVILIDAVPLGIGTPVPRGSQASAVRQPA